MFKILLVADFPKFGGTRTYFKALLEFYAKNGFQVIVGLNSTPLDREIETMINTYGFVCYRLIRRPRYLRNLWFRFPFSWLFDLFSVFPILRRNNIDCITVSTGNPGAFLGLTVLSHKLIYVLHTYPMRPINWFYRRLLGMLLREPKNIFTVSSFARKQIIDCWFNGKDRASVTVIPNSAGEAMSKPSMSMGEPYRVFTLGHVTAYKNPIIWIEIARQVNKRAPKLNVEFIWAGDGDLLDECCANVHQSGYANIKFIGYQRDVTWLYETSAIYVQPSLIESQGISVLEAMRYGLPCVVSDAGGLPESVVEGKTGFVVNVDHLLDIADKIILLLSDDVKRHQMGLAAWRRYSEKYSLEEWTRKMLQAYSR